MEFRLGTHRWNLALREVGYGNRLHRVRTVAPDGNANRVEYRRGALTEWYVNGPLGIEQGFTLAERPATVGATDGGPLTLAFDLSGNVSTSRDASGRGLSLSAGGATFKYAGLTAWDATGRELETTLDLRGSRLRLQVNDRGATYPLTIDPVVQAARLTSQINCSFGGPCDDGKASDQFGFAVAMSTDASTVVVGVPFRTTNNVRTGAAYVFVKPPDQQGGWDSFTPLYFANKLMASDAATNGLYLGRSVAISANGSTIVAGAPGLSLATLTGNAYVFVRPAAGWGGATTRTQTAKLGPRDAQYYYPYGSFGYAVTISDDGGEVIVGAPFWSDRYGTWPEMGAIFAYWRTPAGWENQLNSLQSRRIDGFLVTNKSRARFGGSVSVSGDGNLMVVGAPEEDDFRGAAYAMGWAASSYGQFLKLGRFANPYAGQYDAFGAQVSMNADGSRFAVSAPGTVLDGQRSGAVFVYDQVSGSPAWTQSAILTSSDALSGGGLGDSLSMSRDGNTIVAGNAQSSGAGTGAAYVFVKPVSGWLNSTENAKVVSPYSVTGDRFAYGVSVSGNGDTWIAGAPSTMINGNSRQGAAYVFTGIADNPVAAVSPSSLMFGPADNGSDPKTVTVTNTGAGPLHVTSVVVQGPFTSTQNCIAASPIAPGASCAETVTYVPISVGHSTGTLTFTDNSGGVVGATQQVSLSGFGIKVATSTAMTVSANPAFVGVPVGVSYLVTPQAGSTAAPTGTVTVQANTGESCTGAAPTGTCTITFADAKDRTLTATDGGDTTFKPSTSPAGSIRVVDFTLAASPASQTIASRKATFTISATALNGFTGAVALGCSGGPAGTTCALTPTSLSLSGNTLTTKANVVVPAGSPRGTTYTLTFTGTVSGVVRTATATLTLR